MLLGRVAYLMSLFVKSRHTAKIILIGAGYEKFRDLTPDLGMPKFGGEPSGKVKHGEKTAESFYIWRGTAKRLWRASTSGGSEETSGCRQSSTALWNPPGQDFRD